MYYFRHSNENHLFIDVLACDFDPSFDSSQKVRINFTTKNIISVSLHDNEGQLIIIKKSSTLYKNIFMGLVDSQWNKFIIEYEPIEGIFNENEESVSPLIALFPHKTTKNKVNSFEKYYPLLKEHQLPIFADIDIIKKHSANEHLHIYYRKEDNIYHICIDEFDNLITTKEIFIKQS